MSMVSRLAHRDVVKVGRSAPCFYRNVGYRVVMNRRQRIEVWDEVISCPVNLSIHKRPDYKCEH
jgi:hypothetical protein